VKLQSLGGVVANGIQSRSLIFSRGQTYRGGGGGGMDIYAARYWTTIGSCCIGMLLNFISFLLFIFI